MSDVTNIDDHRPHRTFEALCVKCLDRWISIARMGVPLKDITCAQCGAGFVVNTGQEFGPDGEIL